MPEAITERVARLESQMLDLRNDMKLYSELSEKRTETLNTMKNEAGIMRNDLTLIKRIVMGTCGMVLATFASIMIKTTFDASQANIVKQIVRELSVSPQH